MITKRQKLLFDIIKSYESNIPLGVMRIQNLIFNLQVLGNTSLDYKFIRWNGTRSEKLELDLDRLEYHGLIEKISSGVTFTHKVTIDIGEKTFLPNSNLNNNDLESLNYSLADIESFCRGEVISYNKIGL